MTQRPGYVAFRVTGKDAKKAFSQEAGGHRWQRVSPTEKRGRVHTSTITVAVLDEAISKRVKLQERDLDIRTTRSGGPGGQHANKTDSAVIMTHKPTGFSVRVETKSQYRNKELAYILLSAKVSNAESHQQMKKRNSKRKGQIGTGMRADKRRTVALQRGTVTDHVTGKSMPSKLYLRGQLDRLW